jgi:NAD(P)H-hydrate epimerase
MIPIYTSEQMKLWDQFTIRDLGIQPLELMEIAADHFTKWFLKHQIHSKQILIVCGNGNNGGDGLAIARKLTQHGYIVTVCIVEIAEFSSNEFTINRNRIENSTVTTLLSIAEITNAIKEFKGEAIIDALIGYGLNRPVNKEIETLIQLINSIDVIKYAVDMPTGMYADKISIQNVVQANYTFTFQSPKLSQLIPETGRYCGELIIGDIGLSEKFNQTTNNDKFFVELSDIKKIYKQRNLFDWKNKYGHLFLIGGQLGMAGAILLATKAALKTGCGLCSIHSIEENRNILQGEIPEAMFHVSIPNNFDSFQCLVIGPGLGIVSSLSQSVLKILEVENIPTVIDADALNFIAANNYLKYLHQNCILTPHPAEFDRLFGKHKDGFERLKKASEVAMLYKIHIILKGRFTAIVTPTNQIYFNSSGNPGLAKGGSGDVLSGILGSLLAQGYEKKEACIMAVYLHGLSADLAKKTLAVESILPTNVIENLSDAFRIIGT